MVKNTPYVHTRPKTLQKIIDKTVGMNDKLFKGHGDL